MARTKETSHPKDVYLRLVTTFPLRRLRSDTEHRQARAIFRRLSGGALDVGTRDYLDVLIDLICDYEAKAGQRLDTSGVSAADVVRHLLAERAMSINACAKAVGMEQSDLTNMLNGKRDWSKSAIVKLSEFFGINPALFLIAA